MSKDQAINFMRRTMKGNVERFIESSEEVFEGIKSNSSNTYTFISNLEKLIRNEFLGQSTKASTEQLWELERQDAIRGLINISICNMCYFDQYTCEFNDHFYWAKLSSKVSDYNFYSKLYYEKLPKPFKSRIINDFEDQKIENPSLGARIWFAKKKIMLSQIGQYECYITLL